MNARSIIPAGRRLKILRRPPESILPAMPRPQRRDCHGRLVSMLLDHAGHGASIADARLVPWHSATFVGARHEVDLRLDGPDAADRAGRMAERLKEAEFSLPGHIVADLTARIIGAEDAQGPALLHLEMRTVEAW